MKRENFNFQVKMEGRKKAIASFSNVNRLNVLNAEVIRLGLIEIVTTRNTEVIFDLSGINFIDSSIVDTFNLLSRMARRFNSVVMLAYVNSELQEMLELIKVHSVFNLRILNEDALKKEAA